jgi:hypothetical protein
MRPSPIPAAVCATVIISPVCWKPDESLVVGQRMSSTSGRLTHSFCDSHGRVCRLDAPHYISLVFIHAKYNEGRLNGTMADSPMANLRGPRGLAAVVDHRHQPQVRARRLVRGRAAARHTAGVPGRA